MSLSGPEGPPIATSAQCHASDCEDEGCGGDVSTAVHEQAEVSSRIHQRVGWDSGAAGADVVTAIGPTASAVLFERVLSQELHGEAQSYADATEPSRSGPLFAEEMALPKPDDELAAMAASVIENALPRGGQLAATLARDAAEMAIALNRLVGKLPGAILMTSLEVVGETRCKRWHKDWYVGRMTVTYGGLPGTVFVSDDKVNFEHFAISGAANDLIVADETDVVTASPGMVALIKGRQWPDGNGVVHRSPCYSSLRAPTGSSRTGTPGRACVVIYLVNLSPMPPHKCRMPVMPLGARV